MSKTSEPVQGKVLIVDDDMIQLELICHIFENADMNLKIFQTRSPLIALDIAMTELPDVIVTDWHMPDMTGIELMQKLQLIDATKDISVVMCTGIRLSDEDLRMAMSTGAVDYVRKPYQPIELLARVDNMLRLVKQHQTIKAKNRALEEEIRRHRITLDKLQMSESKLKRSLEENQRLARLDVLTELPNRRASTERYQSMSSMANRKKLTMALAIADIDNFKKVNDKYGHHGGDLVLCEAAKIFKSSIRESDFVGRWGGEEFIFFFMDVDAGGARNVAEKVRNALAQHAMECNNKPLSVTTSIGVVMVTNGFDEAIKAADEALYRCKQNGRNRTEVITDPLDEHIITAPL